MPLLFCVRQHRAMVSVQRALQEGERLFAFLDDIYAVCSPSRVGEVYSLIQRHLWEQTGIRVHQGKTKIWNAGGVKPPVADVLTARAQVDHPEALVWRGDPSLDVSRQGLNVLGVPVGHPQYVAAQLNHKGAEQAVLFARIPWVEDVQIAWLLLTFCAATRANYWLRTVPPELTAEYARVHDNRVLQCLSDVLQITDGFPGQSLQSASLPFDLGRFGSWRQRTCQGCSFLGQLG